MRNVRVIFAALVATIVLCGASAGCGSKPTLSGPLDAAKDLSVKTSLRAIQIGIQAYVATNGSVPVTLDQSTIGQLVGNWPTNPFTSAPMAQGTAPGDISYSAGQAGGYSLGAYLSDGSLYVLQ